MWRVAVGEVFMRMCVKRKRPTGPMVRDALLVRCWNTRARAAGAEAGSGASQRSAPAHQSGRLRRITAARASRRMAART